MFIHDVKLEESSSASSIRLSKSIFKDTVKKLRALVSDETQTIVIDDSATQAFNAYRQ